MMQDLISASYPTGPTMLQRTIMAPAANLLTPPYNSPTSTTVTFPTAPGTYRALRSDMTLAMAQSPYLVQGPSSIKSSWSQSP